MAARFTVKCLLSKKGQKRTLIPGMSIVFHGLIEAHIVDEAEPVPSLALNYEITDSDLTWTGYYGGEILIIPDTLPSEARVPFMKMVQNCYDLNFDEGDELDNWWHDIGKATWPPPRNEWLDKRPDND